MILTYAPDGQEEQRWEFQLGKLRTRDTEAIEKRTGMAFDSEFREALLKGNTLARRALLWVFLRQTHHALRFDDVDFASDEVKVTMDRGEWEAARDEVERNRAIPDDDKALALAMIDQQIADLDPDEVDGAEGKATAKTDATDTP